MLKITNLPNSEILGYIASQRAQLFKWTRRKFIAFKMVANRSLDGITCRSTGGQQTGHMELRLNYEECLLHHKNIL